MFFASNLDTRWEPKLFHAVPRMELFPQPFLTTMSNATELKKRLKAASILMFTTVEARRVPVSCARETSQTVQVRQ